MSSYALEVAPKAPGASARRPPSPIKTRVEEIGAHDSLARDWQDLEQRSTHSFFQSWTWIGTWLGQLPPQFRPHVVTSRQGARIVGLSVIVPRSVRRYGVLRSKGLHLNEAGDPYHNGPYIEYNGTLAEDSYADAVTRDSLACLADHFPDFDEIHLSGVEGALGDLCQEAAAGLGLTPWVRHRARANQVDLEGVRRGGRDYLQYLSRNTRAQIRRAMRAYAEAGPLTLTAAGDADEALRYLDRLKGFHQATWARRGQPGAFSNAFFEKLHRTLIRQHFASGAVQVLKVAAGNAEVGYLYNFRHHERVYAYQTGFNYQGQNRLKPGLVGHTLAIEHNLEQGAGIYDFMAGEERHKASLGTAAPIDLTWLVLQRDRLKYRLERLLLPLARRMARRPHR